MRRIAIAAFCVIVALSAPAYSQQVQPPPSTSAGQGSGAPQGSGGPRPTDANGSPLPQSTGAGGSTSAPQGSGGPRPTDANGSPLPQSTGAGGASGAPQPSGAGGASGAPQPSGSGGNGQPQSPQGTKPPVNATGLQRINEKGNATSADVREALGNLAGQLPGNAPPSNNDVKTTINATAVLRNNCPANQQCGQDADAALNVYRAISNSSQSSSNNSERLPPADAQRIANDTLFFAGKTSNTTALQQAVQVAAALLPSLKDSNPNDASKVIDGTAAKLAASQPPGERAVVRAGNLTLCATRVNTSSNEQPPPLEGEGVKVRLPARLPTSNSSAVVGLSAVTYANASDAPGASNARPLGTQRSACVEVSVSLNGEKTNVSGLSQPITIDLNVTGGPSTGKRFVCAYLDTTSGNWSTAGVTTGTYNTTSGTVPCASTHLTMFSVQETDATTSPTSGPLAPSSARPLAAMAAIAVAVASMFLA